MYNSSQYHARPDRGGALGVNTQLPQTPNDTFLLQTWAFPGAGWASSPLSAGSDLNSSPLALAANFPFESGTPNIPPTTLASAPSYVATRHRRRSSTRGMSQFKMIVQFLLLALRAKKNNPKYRTAYHFAESQALFDFLTPSQSPPLPQRISATTDPEFDYLSFLQSPNAFDPTQAILHVPPPVAQEMSDLYSETAPYMNVFLNNQPLDGFENVPATWNAFMNLDSSSQQPMRLVDPNTVTRSTSSAFLEAPPITPVEDISSENDGGDDSLTPEMRQVDEQVKIITNGNNGPWRCNHDSCAHKTSTFPRKCDLRKHLKRHLKIFKCTVQGCDNKTGFPSDKDRIRHEAKHKPGIKCEYPGCERVFSRVDNMRDHKKRIHDSEKTVLGKRRSPSDDDEGPLGPPKRHKSPPKHVNQFAQNFQQSQLAGNYSALPQQPPQPVFAYNEQFIPRQAPPQAFSRPPMPQQAQRNPSTFSTFSDSSFSTRSSPSASTPGSYFSSSPASQFTMEPFVGRNMNAPQYADSHRHSMSGASGGGSRSGSISTSHAAPPKLGNMSFSGIVSVATDPEGN